MTKKELLEKLEDVKDNEELIFCMPCDECGKKVDFGYDKKLKSITLMKDDEQIKTIRTN